MVYSLKMLAKQHGPPPSRNFGKKSGLIPPLDFQRRTTKLGYISMGLCEIKSNCGYFITLKFRIWNRYINTICRKDVGVQF